LEWGCTRALEFLHSPLSPLGERVSRARPENLNKNVETPVAGPALRDGPYIWKTTRRGGSATRPQRTGLRATLDFRFWIWDRPRLLPSAHCQLLTAYCLLPTAYCLLLTANCLLPTAYCLLPSAYCLRKAEPCDSKTRPLGVHSRLPGIRNRCQVSGARCQVSGVRIQVSGE
jgi:hypothetical protein